MEVAAEAEAPGHESNADVEPATLFVNHLPATASEADVRALLVPFGALRTIQLVHDRFTHEPRGCALVQFATAAAADAAAQELNGKRTLAGQSAPLVVRPACKAGATQLALESAPRLRGEPGKLGCAPDQPLKLYIGHIPESVTEEQLRPVFEPFGQLLELVILRQNGASRGCGFAHYARADAAYAAIEALHGKCRLDESQPELIVRVADAEKRAAQNPTTAAVLGSTPQVTPVTAALFSKASGTSPPPALPAPAPQPAAAALPATAALPAVAPLGTSSVMVNSSAAAARAFITRPQQTGPPGANLFVRGLPWEFGEKELSALFEAYGTVLSTKVYRDQITSQSKGFGFVSFAEPAQAQRAIQALDNKIINGRPIMVQLKGGGGPAARPPPF